jgi:hypothetical protein
MVGGRLEPSEGDDEYTEAVVKLPHLPVLFTRPELPADLSSVRARRHEVFGLPARSLGGEERWYVCTQSLFKFHPDFDEAVGRILAGDAQGRFVIIHTSSTSSELLNATGESR